MMNRERNFAKALINEVWPTGFRVTKSRPNSKQTERVVYCNPLGDFTPEGMRKFLEADVDQKEYSVLNQYKNQQNLLAQGFPHLEDVEKLYKKYPHYQGSI